VVGGGAVYKIAMLAQGIKGRAKRGEEFNDATLNRREKGPHRDSEQDAGRLRIRQPSASDRGVVNLGTRVVRH